MSKVLLEECNEEQRAALQSCIDATPVDGLGISSCDCEQLGVPNYYEVCSNASRLIWFPNSYLY